VFNHLIAIADILSDVTFSGFVEVGLFLRRLRLSVFLFASKCSKTHDAEFNTKFVPTAKKQMSAFMDEFADAKEYISISLHMISRDEPLDCTLGAFLFWPLDQRNNA
jgi:hypothetical protein